ncbi:MAG: 50S ribosomal protein L24 [Metallosphaera sp.]|uniref:50S ribosomal protein L24 n=1 Tax=Metallosphaera sp. TaxID=2020860 RepID=UPI0031642BBC
MDKVKVVASLSNDLIKEYNIKRITVRKDDTVRVIRGDNFGFEGKVTQVYHDTGRIAIEGLTRKKSDGTPIYIRVHASKVEITKLNTNDPRRREIINRISSSKKGGSKER